LAGASVAYSQGVINWVDYASTGSGYEIEVFGPATAGAAAVNNLGNTANDLPAGTATYAGAPLSGSAYEIGLYVGSSPSAATAAALTGTPIATASFLTGANAGFYAGGGTDSTTKLIATDPSGPSSVYVVLAAWSTAQGASSYASAITDGSLAGYSLPSKSAVSEVSTAGTPPPTPNNLGGLGLTDFAIGSVPEPSTIALGVMGASAFLMRLRRK